MSLMNHVEILRNDASMNGAIMKVKNKAVQKVLVFAGSSV